MAFPDGWGYRWPIAINADSVISSAVSTWPCLITDVHFPAGAWAHMNADASDLRFSSDKAGTVELYYDAPRISVSGQSAHLYVQVPTLSSTGDTTIYAWVGNAAATAPSAAWMQNTYPADWAAFWPMEEGTGTTVGDRTANANHGTLVNMDAGTDWVQQADGSWVLDFAGDNDRILWPNAASTKPALPLSFGVGMQSRGVVGGLIANDYGVNFRYAGAQLALLANRNVWLSYGDYTGDGPQNRRSKLSSVVVGTSFRAIHGAIRGATDMSIYLDGEEIAGTYSGSGGAMAYTTASGVMGQRQPYYEWFNGTMGWAALWARSLTADEAAVDAVQHLSPATWASAGELVAVGGGAAYRPWLITGGRMR